jgi:hypothetical protein
MSLILPAIPLAMIDCKREFSTVELGQEIVFP